jgi:hypothetical protein
MHRCSHTRYGLQVQHIGDGMFDAHLASPRAAEPIIARFTRTSTIASARHQILLLQFHHQHKIRPTQLQPYSSAPKGTDPLLRAQTPMPEACLLRTDSKLLMPGGLHKGQTSAASRAHRSLLNAGPLRSTSVNFFLKVGMKRNVCTSN